MFLLLLLLLLLLGLSRLGPLGDNSFRFMDCHITYLPMAHGALALSEALSVSTTLASEAEASASLRNLRCRKQGGHSTSSEGVHAESRKPCILAVPLNPHRRFFAP